jgi:hypothetical protein
MFMGRFEFSTRWKLPTCTGTWRWCDPLYTSHVIPCYLVNRHLSKFIMYIPVYIICTFYYLSVKCLV